MTFTNDYEHVDYHRVIPRDFFNESKLLKCLGQLHLLIHDEMTNGLNLRAEHDGKSFDIRQNQDGDITVTNYRVYLNDEPIYLYTPLNSKDKYPLQGIYRDGFVDVLTESGELSPDLADY